MTTQEKTTQETDKQEKKASTEGRDLSTTAKVGSAIKEVVTENAAVAGEIGKEILKGAVKGAIKGALVGALEEAGRQLDAADAKGKPEKEVEASVVADVGKAESKGR